MTRISSVSVSLSVVSLFLLAPSTLIFPAALTATSGPRGPVTQPDAPFVQANVCYAMENPAPPPLLDAAESLGWLAPDREAMFSPSLEPAGTPGPLVSLEGQRRFDHIIRQAARKFGVDFYLIKGIIKAESKFNPWAVSRRGARGLMQLMPKTARAMGVKDIFDPRDNIFAGVRYLKDLLTIFHGNHRLALAAYNAGSAYVKKYGGVPPFPVTQKYLTKVLNYAEEFKFPPDSA
jgi:soluble lytic murein transglycosylase-like protein